MGMLDGQSENCNQTDPSTSNELLHQSRFAAAGCIRHREATTLTMPVDG